MDPRLDPDVRALAEARAQTKPKRIREMGYVKIRDWMESLEHPSNLPEMADTATRWIPGGGGDVKVDIYTPSPDARDAVLYFHGGGMVMGSNHSFRPLALYFAHYSGAKVIAVDYRLAPEHPFPAQIEDCYAATEWVVANAAELGIDPERIAVMGDSAGGMLAAGVSLMARDLNGPKLLCQVLLYPGVDSDMGADSIKEFADGPGLTQDDIRYLRDIAGDGLNAMSPYQIAMFAPDLSGLPQTIIAVAECDPTRDWDERFARRLMQSRVQTTITRYPGMIHGFMMNVNHVARARLAMAEAGALLAAKFQNPLPW